MYRYEFEAFNGTQSACNIYTLYFGKVKYIGFEDINDGTSVTNSSNLLATRIVQENGWEPNDCLFFEWYAHLNGKFDIDAYTVDEVIYIWKDKVASGAQWKEFCPLKENPFKN